MKLLPLFCIPQLRSRSPLGLRGLKFGFDKFFVLLPSRSPLGLRGLKSKLNEKEPQNKSRSPLGLRGLKYLGEQAVLNKEIVAAHSGCVD